MGVELQHTILYGYEFDYDDLPNNYAVPDTFYDRYHDHKPDEEDFVICADGRAGEYCFAGIVEYMSDSVRWNGPQCIPPHRLDETPNATLVEAMNRTIAEEFPMEPLHDNPEYIVFTNDW